MINIGGLSSRQVESGRPGAVGCAELGGRVVGGDDRRLDRQLVAGLTPGDESEPQRLERRDDLAAVKSTLGCPCI
jgi:hypothetical protein